MLIAARAVQGLAGATLVPSVMSLVVVLFPDERQRTAAMGIVMSTFAAGAALGPLVGGALLKFFPWNSVFLVNVPVLALLLILGPRLLPEFRSADAGRIDLCSAALSLAGVLAFVYGIKQIVHDGLQPVSALAVVAGLSLLVVFLRRQRGLDDPLLDLQLFVTARSRQRWGRT